MILGLWARLVTWWCRPIEDELARVVERELRRRVIASSSNAVSTTVTTRRPRVFH